MTIIIPNATYIIEIYIKEGVRVREFESIVASSLPKALAKLVFAVHSIQEKEYKLAAAKLADDDIPF